MKQIGTILNGNENRMLYQLFLISSVNDMAQICTPHKNETLVKNFLLLRLAFHMVNELYT